MGMGEIGSTLSGIHASYNNPANAFSKNKFEANVSIVNQYEISELLIFQVSALYKLKKYGSIGINANQLGTGDYIDQKFGLLYNLKISDNVRVGAQLDWFHNRVMGYSNIDVISFDLGASYNISKDVSLSMHLFNPANQSYTKDRNLPTIMALGIKYLSGKMLEFHAEIEKNSYHPFKIKSALRYFPSTRYSMTIGVLSDLDSAAISGGFQYLHQSFIRIDFGISYNLLLGISSGLSLDYYFE